jgi:hypothetical protein
MQSGLRWVGRTAVGASRSHWHALRAAVWRPCGCRGTVALVRRCAQCSSQWPAASYLVCAPPTLWPRRCAALALRWSARPPPRGSLSPAHGGFNNRSEIKLKRYAHRFTQICFAIRYPLCPLNQRTMVRLRIDQTLILSKSQVNFHSLSRGGRFNTLLQWQYRLFRRDDRKKLSKV